MEEHSNSLWLFKLWHFWQHHWRILENSNSPQILFPSAQVLEDHGEGMWTMLAAGSWSKADAWARKPPSSCGVEIPNPHFFFKHRDWYIYRLIGILIVTLRSWPSMILWHRVLTHQLHQLVVNWWHPTESHWPFWFHSHLFRMAALWWAICQFW